MSEDYIHNFGKVIGIQKAYNSIISHLDKENFNLSNLPNMPPITEIEEIDDQLPVETAYEKGKEQYDKLNEKQKEIVDFIIDIAENKNNNKPNCIYIDGPGGSGKTYIYTTLCYLLRSTNKNVCTMAYTGIAATLLPNGKTTHETFSLPVPIHEDSSSNIKPNSKQGQYLKNIDAFIWDEAPMAPRYVLEVIDRTLRDITNEDSPFDRCIASNNINIVDNIYGSIIDRHEFNELSNRAVLTARHIDVDRINKEIIRLLDVNTERIYTSVDSTENCDNEGINDAILPEYLNTLNPPNFPPHELQFRVNTILMVIRNLNVSEGLCNGTRLLLLELKTNLLKCKILNGDKVGEIVFINRITLYCENIYPFTFKRRQFPVTLAFAMTINKAQGPTFNKIGIDSTKNIFSHGQLYVALSRVRSWDSLQVYLNDQRLNNFVKNYVFTELYQ
ncbi:ATP-dependent DNA helicase PIF1-like [Chelonus insularis]|uniref:ATP-dependent DNA helicase PIF1-like n=1 Tax=Chelonus insularis TaxID=460826 RepID=UPI00158A71A8|nr:ATP-dependent DNA helicase PIF1-like [Chelonus insularis]